LHNNGPFWVKGTLILDAPVVSPGALLLVSFTCSWILSRIYVCFLVLPFFFLGFARNCCVNCNWFDSFAFVPIHEHGSFFASFSNLHFSCCESRVLMEILLTVSMSLTSQLWITLTSKITRFRWGILLFLSNAFSFYNSKFFIWLAPFFFLSFLWFKLEFQTITGCWCRWNQISILKDTLLGTTKSLQIPSLLHSYGTKMGGALKEQFL